MVSKSCVRFLSYKSGLCEGHGISMKVPSRFSPFVEDVNTIVTSVLTYNTTTPISDASLVPQAACPWWTLAQTPTAASFSSRDAAGAAGQLWSMTVAWPQGTPDSLTWTVCTPPLAGQDCGLKFTSVCCSCSFLRAIGRRWCNRFGVAKCTCSILLISVVRLIDGLDTLDKMEKEGQRSMGRWGLASPPKRLLAFCWCPTKIAMAGCKIYRKND